MVRFNCLFDFKLGLYLTKDYLTNTYFRFMNDQKNQSIEKKIHLDVFPVSTASQWEDKIACDLKGKPLSSLRHTTSDGIDIQPNYTTENSASYGFATAVTESIKTSHSREQWYINQEFNCRKPERANTKIREALSLGVDSIKISVSDTMDFNILFKDILPAHLEIRFKNASYAVIKNFYHWSIDNQYDTTLFHGTFDVFYHRISDKETRLELAQKVIDYFPNMCLVNVNGDNFFNQGSSNVQQLAISMALAHEVFAELIDGGIAADQAAKLIGFSFATGSDYFSEIAKYRAFKVLWQVVLTEYGANSIPVSVHGITSAWNQTTLDLNNNLLRGATQALSAIIGGCSTLTVLPFDASVRRSNDFSDRLARNTQLIIRDEAFASKVIDAASGSYFIEKLTMEIAEKTWDLFIEIEDLGGFKVNMDNGYITQCIAAHRDVIWGKVKSGETPILGVNSYPNPTEDRDKIHQEIIKNKIKGLRLSDAVTVTD